MGTRETISPRYWWKKLASANKKLWIQLAIGTFFITIIAWGFFNASRFYLLNGTINFIQMIFLQAIFIVFLNIIFGWILSKAFKNIYLREAELFLEKEGSEAVLTSIGDGVIEVDRYGTMSVFNKAAERITGFQSEKVLGKHYTEVLKFMTEDDETIRYDFIERALRDGVETSLPKKSLIVTDTGKKVPVSDSAAPVRDNQRNIIGVVVVFRDITKEHELEKVKLEFLSLASHQLRTPLSGIKWLIETLESGKVGPLTKEQQEYLHYIAQSNERMIKLVHDLLSVIRLEGEGPSINVTSFSLHEFMKEIYEFSRIPAEKEALHFQWEPPTEDFTIASDRVLLKTIIDIFIANAIVYTKKEGRILFVAKPQGEFIEFSVADDGIGIPREERRNIFNKFYRASNAKMAQPEGTGLGLYIAKFLATILGGVIQVESEENRGSTFHLTVPLRLRNFAHITL